MKLVEKLINVWNNRLLILNGFKNYITRRDHIEKLANTRMSICEECPLLDLKGTKCFAPGTQPCCGSCGCSLKLKTRSEEAECPEGKW